MRVRVFARVNEYLHTHIFGVHRFVTIHSEFNCVHVTVRECVCAYPCLCVMLVRAYIYGTHLCHGVLQRVAFNWWPTVQGASFVANDLPHM